MARDIGASYSLLVSEKSPDTNLQDALTAESEDVWYHADWFNRRVPDEESPDLSRLDVLVYLPPAGSYSDNRKRLNIARDVLQRYITAQRDKDLERYRKIKYRVAAFALASGDTVTHAKYGVGTVISTSGDGEEAKVAFGAEIGLKHLLVSYAPLQKL